MTYQSINPFSGELLKRFDQNSDVHMKNALAAADTAFRTVWSTATFRDRARIMGRAASLMSARKESLARVASLEMGKRIAEARDEVDLSVAILAY
jgi:succinate-semialdehyde dehydrogenase/glutarate-semialdehyde dehydrogenase